MDNWLEGYSVKKAETTFKEKVMRDLKTLRSAWFFKSQEVAVRGIPDIILCLGGFFVALELKASDFEKPDPLQDYHLKRINIAGGRAHLVTPGSWPSIFAWLSTTDAKSLEKEFGP